MLPATREGVPLCLVFKLVQIYADVLGEPISIPPSSQGPALGAAILGVLAAGFDACPFASAQEAILAMAGSKSGVPDRESVVVHPDQQAHNTYSRLDDSYRKLADYLAAAP
jgi:L-ribulokinase